MTIAINSVRSTRFVLSTFLLLLSFGVVGRPAIATPSPNAPILIAQEKLTAEQWREKGDEKFSTDLPGAIAAYTQAIKLAPNDEYHYYARATAYVANNDNVRALQDYNQAIRIAPKSGNAYASRAIFYCSKNDQKAIADWDRAVQLTPDNRVVESQRADCLMTLRKYQAAIDGYTKAIKLETNDQSQFEAENYLKRGKGYQILGNVKAAIADFNQAIKLAPNNGDAYYMRALAKRSIRQKQEALQDFKQAAKYLEGTQEFEQIMTYIKELQ